MKRFVPRSIFGLVAALGVALAVVTFVLGFAMQEIAHEALEQQLDHRVEAETKALLASTGGDPAALARAIDGREDGHRADGLGHMLVNPQGVHLAGRMRAAVPPPGWHEYLTNAPPGEIPELMQSLVTQLPGGGRLVVAADRAPIDEIDETIIGLTFGALGAMLLFAIVSAWLLGTVVKRRLGRIVDTAQAIIAGDHRRRMPIGGADTEFDRVSGTLNRLLDRNVQLIDNLRQVSSDVAHDLRTPLARQQLLLDAALAQPIADEACRRTLETVKAGGDDMLALFAAILRISEIDTFAVRSHFKAVDLTETIERVADAYRPAAEASGHHLTVVDDGPAIVDGDPRLLSQLAVNLVENALRHTPPGTTVTVSTTCLDGVARLSVADDGPGIASADRERVLDRFVRLEHSRTTPGHGLGLSLVASIARAHNADLVLRDGNPGLSVDVQFARTGRADAR